MLLLVVISSSLLHSFFFVNFHFLLFLCVSPLNNRLQLSSVTQGIFNHHLTKVLLLAGLGFLSRREVDLSVLYNPAAAAGEIDDGAFAIEEQEGFGGRQGKGWVCALAGRGNLAANLVGENL